jgi:5-methylcytosine-specific restriction protein A
VGVIYGPEFEFLPELQARVKTLWRFSPLYNEGPDTPFFIGFNSAKELVQAPDIQEAWIRAVLLEMQRAKSSPYRKFHQPAVYEAAVNLGYRAMIFDEAFSV